MPFSDKDISKVILETLLDTKEIEITGIATLKSKLRPSKVDTKRDVITAPEHFIEISHSKADAKITIEEAIADYYQLSEEESTAAVKQWKSTTAYMISPDAYLLDIEGVGKVTYDRHRSLCFIPDVALFLALNPLQTSVIVHPMPEVKDASKTVKHPKDASNTSNTPGEHDQDRRAQDDDTTQFWRQLSYLFAALLAIAIATAIYLYFFREPEVHVKEIYIERSTPAPAIETPADTIAIEAVAAEATTAAEERYLVIGGAFKEIARATSTRDKFLEKGYKSARIIQRGTLNMVIICGYPTKEEADNFISNTPYTELGLSEPSWVLKIE